MKKKMETTATYCRYVGIMEEKVALLCKCGQVAAGFACSCFSAGIEDVCVDFLQSLHEPLASSCDKKSPNPRHAGGAPWPCRQAISKRGISTKALGITGILQGVYREYTGII